MNHINARELLFVICQLLCSPAIFQQSKKVKTNTSLELILETIAPLRLDIAFDLSIAGKYIVIPKGVENKPIGLFVAKHSTIIYTTDQRTRYVYTADAPIADSVILRIT